MAHHFTPPTREELVSLCERGVVPVEKWADRDSPSAQLQLGQAWALLKSGAEFTVTRESDPNTWWVVIDFPSFDSFEYDRSLYFQHERFYIPTETRLREGQDWY